MYGIHSGSGALRLPIPAEGAAGHDWSDPSWNIIHECFLAQFEGARSFISAVTGGPRAHRRASCALSPRDNLVVL